MSYCSYSAAGYKINIKKYKQQTRLEQNKKENNNYKSSQIKKLSLSSRAFILFKEGKKIDEAKVLLDIPFKLAIRYWKRTYKDCLEISFGFGGNHEDFHMGYKIQIIL